MHALAYYAHLAFILVPCLVTSALFFPSFDHDKGSTSSAAARASSAPDVDAAAYEAPGHGDELQLLIFMSTLFIFVLPQRALDHLLAIVVVFPSSTFDLAKAERGLLAPLLRCCRLASSPSPPRTPLLRQLEDDDLEQTDGLLGGEEDRPSVDAIFARRVAPSVALWLGSYLALYSGAAFMVLGLFMHPSYRAVTLLVCVLLLGWQFAASGMGDRRLRLYLRNARLISALELVVRAAAPVLLPLRFRRDDVVLLLHWSCSWSRPQVEALGIFALVDVLCLLYTAALATVLAAYLEAHMRVRAAELTPHIVIGGEDDDGDIPQDIPAMCSWMALPESWLLLLVCAELILTPLVCMLAPVLQTWAVLLGAGGSLRHLLAVATAVLGVESAPAAATARLVLHTLPVAAVNVILSLPLYYAWALYNPGRPAFVLLVQVAVAYAAVLQVPHAALTAATDIYNQSWLGPSHNFFSISGATERYSYSLPNLV